MVLSGIVSRLEAVPVVDAGATDPDVQSVCASDLMSDILAFDHPQFVLLTGLTTPQVIRAAEVMDAVAVFVVGGRSPLPAAVEAASLRAVRLYATALPLYEACVRLAMLSAPAGCGDVDPRVG